MKYIEAFRDGELARKLAATIHAEAGPARQYRLMEFCGGHTHAIARYGLPDLLPGNIRLIHGPGCPVCVLPTGRIDSAIELSREHDVILCTYADTMRVPASASMSLLKARAAGADVRMVYSCADALTIAETHPDRQVAFFAIGFETTTPPTAATILRAQKLGLSNFSVFCNHVLTPPAMAHIMESAGDADAVGLDGFLGPSHVSTVIGYGAYEGFAKKYGRPVVIAGFEPLDVMQSILLLLRQINGGRADVENQFDRVVSREGNLKAQAMCEQVFELRDAFEWRGLGSIPHSALAIRPEYGEFDAERRFALPYRQVPDHKACECAAILRGHKQPADCKVFGRSCTPDRPLGACMVSSEGACAAHFTYGRFRATGQNGASE